MASSNCGVDGPCSPQSVVVSTCSDGTPCIVAPRLFENSPIPVSGDAQASTTLEIARKLFAETLGTAILVSIVVGSGIMAQSLSPGDVGLQLLENAIATGTGLIGLILMFGPVSGAHFNPVVSMVDFLHGDMSLRDMILYSVCQVAGGILGTVVTCVEYKKDVTLSDNSRDDPNLWLGEAIGTVSLLLVIHGCLRTGQKASVPYAVGAWICGGYFFTSSTIFANPAVTIARMFTNTFAGIAPSSVGAFIGFQYLGCFIAYFLIRFLYPVNLELKKDDNLYLRLCINSYDKV